MLNALNSKKTSLFLKIIFYLILFLYVLYRANSLSFTHDESVTYFLVKGDLFWLNSANNHLFNTYLINKSLYYFGEMELALRLPNVISFILYLIFAHLILKESINNIFLILGTSLVLLNPFVIEYFSLARGYGISLGFLLASLYFLLKLDLSKFSFKSFAIYFSCSMFLGSFSLYANLSTINYYLCILILYILYYTWYNVNIVKLNIRYDAIFLLLLFISLIPLYYAAKRLLFLNSLNTLTYGSETLKETYSSIINGSLYYYNKNLFITNLVQLGFILLFLLGILLLILKQNFNTNFFKITSLISLLIIGLFLEHDIFKVKYPLERTAIYFLPLFSLFIYYFSIAIFSFISQKYQVYYLVILSILVTIPIIINFSLNINLKSTYTWRFDIHSKEIINKIVEKTKNNNEEIHINTNWMFEPSLRYYLWSRKLTKYHLNIDSVSNKSQYVYKFNSDTKQPDLKEIERYNDLDLTSSNDCCGAFYENLKAKP